MEEMTIAEIAAMNEDLEILVQALAAADLVDTVNTPEFDFTVFAPTDAAFAGLAATLGYTGDVSDEDAVFAAIAGALAALDENGDPIPLLTDVLFYHLVPGGLTLAEVSAADSIDTALAGAAIQPQADGTIMDADPDTDDPAVIEGLTDIAASNGIVHVIDGVLLPLNAPMLTNFTGTDADDEITVGAGILSVDGGDGNDTAGFAGNLEDTDFGYIDGGFSARTDGLTTSFISVEQFQFADETVVVSDSELAASVFRLYGIGLGREADIPGVTFWTGEAEANGLGFVADAILVSDEFVETFGGEVPDDDSVVEAFYQNLLGRDPDQAGLEFWQGVIEGDNFDTSDLLVAFAQSPEYRDTTENLTDDGVLLLG